MKFSTASIAALATIAATASATLTINEPWGQTTWTAGGNGSVTWNSTADEAGKLCEIHLLTGDAAAATFVANLTSNGNLVPCNYTRVNFNHLPDYAAGDYFVRLGQNGGNIDLYSYSTYFKYVGNGTTTTETPAVAVTDTATQPAVSVDSTPATI